MKKALLGDREDTVKFMLKKQHGLNINHFVTPDRLQDLYLSVISDLSLYMLGQIELKYEYVKLPVT